MLFGVGCNPDDKGGEADSEMPVITVSPESFATDLEGGEQVLTVTSNATWEVDCDQEDVIIAPLTGKGNGSVTVTLPAATTARSFAITFNARKEVAYPGLGTQTVAAEPASVSVYQNANASESAVTNVAEIRAALKALNPTETAAAVSEEVASMTLVGVVTGSGKFGNMSSDKQISVQDDNTNPHSGLTVRWDATVELEHGSIIELSLAGAKVQTYKGLLQLTPAQAATVAGRVSNLAPIEISYDDYNNYESQYVKLSGLIPGTADVPWYSGTSSFKTHNFTNTDGKSVIVYVSKYAPFVSETIPNKMGSIAGIATVFNADKQLLPQSLADIQLTEDIVEPEATSVTIAQITEVGAYKVENAWVVGFTGNGVILTDASGAFINVYIYGNEHKTIGEKMTVDGDVQIRQGGFQFYNPTVTVLDGTATVSYPTPNQYEGAALEALCEKYATANASYLAEYVELKGVVTKSEAGHYGIVFSGVDNSKYEASLSKTPDAALGLDAVIGKSVIMRGFVTDYEIPYLGVVAVSIEEDANAVALAASDITNVPVDGVTNATANITVVGIDTVNATCDGTIVTAASVAGNVLTYSVAKNEGEAREGWIKLSAEGVEDVTIAVKQRGTAPTGGKFVKVTGPLSDYSGTYLIIYDGREDANTGKSLITLNASLGKSVDAAGNFVKVTAESDGSIAFNETNMANAVEIAKIAGTENYSLNIAGGVYIGSTSGDKNELKFNETAPIANSISVDADGVATITSALDTAKPVTFKFYSSSNGARFRYYKSVQKMPSLYKLVE